METNEASMENHGIMLPGGAQKRINEMRIRTRKGLEWWPKQRPLLDAMRNMDSKASRKKPTIRSQKQEDRESYVRMKGWMDIRKKAKAKTPRQWDETRQEP